MINENETGTLPSFQRSQFFAAEKISPVPASPCQEFSQGKALEILLQAEDLFYDIKVLIA